MRTYFFLIICALVTSAPLIPARSAAAQEALPDAVRAFDEGTVHLLDGNFSAAVTSFKAANDTGWASPELYYNLSLAYHRMNKLGLAVTYLEKAKRLDPQDQKILHSISVANHKQVDRFSQLPEPFWRRIHKWSSTIFPVGPSFWVGVTFWFLLAGLFVGKLLLAWRGDWWRRARIVVGALATLFIFHSLTTSAWPPIQEQGVVVVTELRLKEEPDDAAPEVIRVHEGLVVTISSRTPDWILIILPNGTKGWVLNGTLEMI